ncbi:MAG: type VI secretion system tip protein VgrG [Marinovum sp.]|nr:type VI secretion system tip protein VgrG [Marinovum sp.]
MPNDTLELENRQIRMEGTYSSSPVNFKNARVVESLSTLTETTVEFFSTNDAIDLQDFLGGDINLIVETGDGAERTFNGSVISVEYVGLYQGQSHFVAELRPWLWFLTRTHDSRIFQEMTVLEIIQEVLTDHGFWQDVEKKTTSTYQPRTYCVQYHESDFDFISRLMEEEGIYYFFENDGKKLKMILADSISAHSPVPDHASIEFKFKEEDYRRRADHIFDWAENTGVTTGKVTLNDYDFEKPKADERKPNSIPKGKHRHKSYEHYRYPAHARPPMEGSAFARVRQEALAVRHLISRGAGNVRTMGVGQTFKLKEHPRKNNNMEYLVTRAVHTLQIETDYESEETRKPLFDSTIPVDEDNPDSYRIVFDVIPKKEPFRAPQVTEWPAISGMQTAVVTGPSGEEIHTDKYGRIKVQFHWDRDGDNNDKSSCWVRCVMPWTGKNWGMIHIPRIGNEVAIHFEEGDPDRPICTGMLYNADNMPPYPLPDDKTKTGIMTRSSKQGNAKHYNELVFEDKKGAEFIRLNAERDMLEVVENNKEVFVGHTHKNLGDLSQRVNRNKTEVVREVRTHLVGMIEDLTVGMVYDEAVGLSKAETIGIYKEETIGLTKPSMDNIVEDIVNLAITIGGPISSLAYGGKYADFGAAATAISSLYGALKQPGKKMSVNGVYEKIITGDKITTVSKSKSPSPGKKGNVETKIEDGDETHEITKGKFTSKVKGNHATKVTSGDLSVNVDMGKITMQAMKSIELKVGGNKILIDQKGITVSGIMVTVEGKATVDVGSPMTTVSADAILTLDGGLTMIN